MERGKRKVPIENILYIFSYIWDEVIEIGKIKLDSSDNFDSVDIICKLFLENVEVVLKKGLYKEYNVYQEEIRGVKGQVKFKESLGNLSFLNGKMVCCYDNLEENNIINRIIKTIAVRLYYMKGINDNYKRQLNKVIWYFQMVDVIELNKDSFKIEFHRNNEYTKSIIMVCRLIYEVSMLSEETGCYEFIDLFDDDKYMETIFEMFIYKFYYRNMNCLVVHSKKLKWNFNGGNLELLPEMRLDIYLEDENNITVIDTKYYKSFYENSYYGEKVKFIPDNLYQMYAYLNHIDSNGKKVRGVLLYPVTYQKDSIEEEYYTKEEFGVGGGMIIEVRTVDLSKRWFDIEKELLKIISVV